MNLVYTATPPFSGQGVMSVTAASQQVATGNVTKAPNSVAFPTGDLPNNLLRVKVQPGAAASVSVCWFGGTATATNGELLAAGESRIVALPAFATTPPTMFAVTGTVAVEIEW